MYRNRKTSGFTLVEILIVVIILGILAAIVIPQFTNASQDARKNSLTSQLQTVRAQLELGKLQHLDKPSIALTTSATDPWSEMVTSSNNDWSNLGSGTLGPYLTAAPTNPLNGGTLVSVISSGAEPQFGDASAAASTPLTATGWVYYESTGKIFATTKSGTLIYNEADGSNADQ